MRMKFHAATFLSVVSVLVTVVSASSKDENTTRCREGLVLPIWMPQENLSMGDIIARGIIYFISLFYMFVGVSIIADRFMASIEVITSKEKEVVVKKPNGETQTISVRIWNETVSNLTLMALGSSAPEILLSIIEVYGQNFQAGELGPGTIVGSAAFNMFVIIAICVSAVPSTENRRIKHLRVFFVTMTWSVFAYIWLYLILTWSSHGVIEVWEGLLTLFFFPATVVTAYIADRRLLIYKYLSKQYRMNKRGIVIGTEGDDVEMGAKSNHIPDGGLPIYEGETTDEMREFEQHRQEYISLLRELRKKHPNCGMEELEMMAREELLNRGPKSRAYYRIQATRKLTGAGNLKKKLERVEQKKEEETKEVKEDCVQIGFDPAHYTVMENVGQFAVTITREGGLNCAVCVDYATEDGTANAGGDYEGVEGTLVFRPGESQKQIFISVIDDDVFEEDEHFYVRLSNARYLHGQEGGQQRAMNGSPAEKLPIRLATPSTATVMILDDDHGGIFSIAESEYEVPESIGMLALKINRYSGARGRVILPFKTLDGTAKEPKDFEALDGQLVFENNETFKEVPIRIIDNESYEKDAIFYVELGEPKAEAASLPVTPDTEEVEIRRTSLSPQTDLAKESEDAENEEDMTEAEKIALLGKPKLGEIYKCEIRIKESKEFKNTVDKLFRKANVSLMVGTSSWKEQFIEAITVSAGDDDDDDNGDEGEEGEEGEEKEEKMPTCTDYVLHFVTLFWKIFFAFVPPTDILDGWVCFIVSIIMIGLLTAVIGDLASHFGCTVGLKDPVTAVAFVALGTSVPDYLEGWACFSVCIVIIGILTAIIGDLASHFGCTIGLHDSVTAISLVALGTSIPDTFASKVAAINDKYADSSIGNVTGSNAVNVFLGIGIAWSIAAVYHAIKGDKFEVDPGSLAFSVTLFCVCALIASAILMLRRNKAVGGELGGPVKYKIPTVLFFVFLWFFYVIMSSLEAYGHIEGF